MMRHICILFAAMLLNVPAMAADACPEKGADGEWAASCFNTDKSGRRLKPQHHKHLRFDSSGHATLVISEPRELVAVNRQGKVVVPGIRHTGDFDFPDAEGGIARFETIPTTPGSKARPQCGYFDSRSFRIVIPAEYAQCRPFANGEAIACKDCASVCTEPECQNSILVDGDGVALGPDGTVRRRFRLPDQKTACAQAGSAEHKAYTGTRPECILKSYNPFK
ncbi:WG repeat-containing protein [Massilia agri]|uniref:WG repeat-containing protein n=1 Tax=Massilia agri TaxID=1886785 RepID=A0ABT2ARD5_9BURK|nr:WG repeat-containing protein [Massilia agri]MCS0598792.1 WG repeat-containing protein [Massilia agri]